MIAKKLVYFLPVALWLALLLTLSSQTYPQQTIIPFLERHISPEQLSFWLPDVYLRYGHVYIEAKSTPYTFVEFVFRKCAHIFSYSVLACTLYFFFNGISSTRKRQGLWWTGMVTGLVFVASLDEWNQSQVPMRTGQSIDVWLDIVGGTAGAAGLIAFARACTLKRREDHGIRSSILRSQKPPG